MHECVYTVPRKNFKTPFEFVDFKITCTASHKIFNSILSKLSEFALGICPFVHVSAAGAVPVYFWYFRCTLC